MIRFYKSGSLSLRREPALIEIMHTGSYRMWDEGWEADMLRKRERFERIDVPRANPYKNVIGLAVIIVIAVLVGLVVTTIWNRVQLESHLGVGTLSKALQNQSTLDTPDGTSPSEDTFTSYAVISADSLKDGGSELQSAHILVINRTQNTGYLISVPGDVVVETDAGTQTLTDIYKGQGQSACIDALSKVTNIKLEHVIISTEDVWEKISALSGSGARSLVSNASSLLASIISDMKPSQLLDLAETIQPIGISNLGHIDAPVTEGSNGPIVDSVALGKAIGMLQ